MNGIKRFFKTYSRMSAIKAEIRLRVMCWKMGIKPSELPW